MSELKNANRNSRKKLDDDFLHSEKIKINNQILENFKMLFENWCTLMVQPFWLIFILSELVFWHPDSVFYRLEKYLTSNGLHFELHKIGKKITEPLKYFLRFLNNFQHDLKRLVKVSR